MTRGTRLALLIGVAIVFTGAVLIALPYKTTVAYINRRTAKITAVHTYFMALKIREQMTMVTAIEKFGALTAEDSEVPCEVWYWRFPWSYWVRDGEMRMEKRGQHIRAAHQQLFLTPLDHRETIPAADFDALMKRRLEIWNTEGVLFHAHVIPKARMENEQIFKLPPPSNAIP